MDINSVKDSLGKFWSEFNIKLKQPEVKWTIIAGISTFIVYKIVRTRIRVQGQVYQGKARLDGKVVIVTGANTGIGKETALDLAKRGGTIIMACRSESRGKSAVNDVINNLGETEAKVVFMPLDLSSMESVRSFANDFNNRYDQLDVLINNAGVAIPEYTLTVDGYETNFATNHLGHFLLTILLLDRLKSSAPSRVVVVSAHPHKNGKIDFEDLFAKKTYSTMTGYFNSKLANVLFSAELAERLKDTGVTTYSLHPGLFRSEILRNMKYINFPIMRQLTTLVLWPFSKTVKQGAQTNIYCAVDPEIQNDTGLYYCDCKISWMKPVNDPELGRKLWDVSEQLVGLKDQSPETMAMLEKSKLD